MVLDWFWFFAVQTLGHRSCELGCVEPCLPCASVRVEIPECKDLRHLEIIPNCGLHNPDKQPKVLVFLGSQVQCRRRSSKPAWTLGSR